MSGAAHLRIEGRLKNRTGRRWCAEDGYALGVQVFDPVSGRFLEEGRWVDLKGAAAPGEELLVAVELEAPDIDGDYRLQVAPVHAEHGWPGEFLQVEVAVRAGAAEVGAVRAGSWSQQRRARAGRAVGEVLTQPFLLARHRALIASMTRRDISARYRGSFGDLFWSWLNPLLLMAAYLFVFGFVLRARFAADPSPTGFALYFLAGMIPWLAFSEALARSPQLLLEHRNLVKKILFPIEVLPGMLTLSGLVTMGIALALYLAGLAFLRGVPATALWLPVLIVPQLLLTLGLSWLMAAVGVFVRDLAQVMGFVLTLWFFLTPICYPEASLPAEALAVLRWNPVLHIVKAWRAVLLDGQAPSWAGVGVLWGIGIGMSFVGYAVFYRLRKSFSDVL